MRERERAAIKFLGEIFFFWGGGGGVLLNIQHYNNYHM